jgi:branched-subunit amino acid ABC-type transport system permease component
MQEYLPFVIAGIASGSIYGLAAMGLVLSYKASGIFNFAHGAIAAGAAYLFFELHVEAGLPWPVAGAICVLGAAPLFGLVLERIGRCLADVPPVRRVVATVGLLLTITSTLTLIYGAGGSATTPQFLPQGRFSVGGTLVEYSQLIVVLISVAAATGLFVFFRSTRLGIAMRGVVDDPSLLALSATSPVRMRSVAWIISACFAAVSGILIAPVLGLDTLLLTLLVVEAFGAAAIGRFSSLPMTYVGGLVVGLLASLSRKFLVGFDGVVGVPPSMPFIVLFAVLLLIPKQKLVQPGARMRAGAMKTERAPLPKAVRLGAVAVGLVALLAAPELVGAKLPVFTNGVTFVIVFLSLGLLVWTSGQVSLCHAAFAGVGAAAMGHFTTGLDLPWAVALLLTGLVTVPVGALVAIPAIRLSGLYLALATFGFGILLQRLAFSRGFLFGADGNSVVPRPGLGRLGTDTGYFYVVSAVMILACLLVWAVYHSRLGLLLRGLADSPLALSTMGTTTTVTQVLVFCISAFLAGVAGGLFAGAVGSSSSFGYGPFESLTWLTVLAVAGTSQFVTALVAAALLAVGPAYVPAGWVKYQTLAFGIVALAVSLQLPQRYELRGRLGRAAEGSRRRREAPALSARRAPRPEPLAQPEAVA